MIIRALRHEPGRARWYAYMQAYEDVLNQTSSARAPCDISLANHKWFARVAVADLIVKTLESLPLA